MVAVYCVLPARLAAGVNVAVLPLTFTVPLRAAPPVVVTRVKLVMFSVEFVIDSEKVADTEELSATPVAALAGEVADTIGGVVSGAAPVVKFQVKLAASALPAASFAAVVMVAVYCVLAARLTEGTSIAVSPLTTTGPVIAVPPAEGLRVKLAAVSVEFVIDSEKVAETEAFGATPVAAFDGDVSDTVGGVVSGAEGTVGPAMFPSITGVSSPPPPPPPQPNRLRLASSAAQKTPAEIFELTFLLFDIREASRINFQMHNRKLHTTVQKSKETGDCVESGDPGRRPPAT
jgi:hypothetical protein